MLDNMSERKPNLATTRFSSVKEFAAEFNVNSFAVYKKIRRNELPHYRFGKKILLDPDEVKAALRVPTKGTGPSNAA
jgi:excisionase family DNA binding protein